jgi:hypothetical protein
MGWPLDPVDAAQMVEANKLSGTERYTEKAFHLALLHRHRQGFDEFSIYRDEGRGLSEPEKHTRRHRSQGMPQALIPVRRRPRKCRA